jgi:hypothetical protein
VVAGAFTGVAAVAGCTGFFATAGLAAAFGFFGAAGGNVVGGDAAGAAGTTGLPDGMIAGAAGFAVGASSERANVEHSTTASSAALAILRHARRPLSVIKL